MRLPLAKDIEDLEGEGDCELIEGDDDEDECKVGCNCGSLQLDGSSYLRIRNSTPFKSSTMKKNLSCSIWVQWPTTAMIAQVVTKGPWRKAFSIGLRHVRGVGNNVRFSCTGAQGQKHIDHTIKDWSHFPELADKELQKFTSLAPDPTWWHFALTLGNSEFKGYVNG